jgi:hypothetical protein
MSCALARSNGASAVDPDPLYAARRIAGRYHVSPPLAQTAAKLADDAIERARAGRLEGRP